jgi:hypothetical protein
MNASINEVLSCALCTTTAIFVTVYVKNSLYIIDNNGGPFFRLRISIAKTLTPFISSSPLPKESLLRYLSKKLLIAARRLEPSAPQGQTAQGSAYGKEAVLTVLFAFPSSWSILRIAHMIASSLFVYDGEFYGFSKFEYGLKKRYST